MIHDIFPSKPYGERMSDRDWETYCCMVWCINSLRSWEDYILYSMSTNGAEREINFDNKMGIANNLNKAQKVILYLLEENGRLREFNEHAIEKSEESTNKED